MTDKLTPVVVLDITYAGHGILRSLAPYGIPLIGLYSDIMMPESKTRLCSRKYLFKDDKILLALLTRLPEQHGERPVLMLTSDAHVAFYLEHRELLDPLYRIDMPDTALVNLLLDKEKFSAFVLEHELLAPKTLLIQRSSDLELIAKSSRFPVIIKPSLKSHFWFKAGLGKAICISDAKDFIAVCNRALLFCEKLILQEWIDGKDTNLHYCLGYFGKTGDAIAIFTGYKFRQWPVGTGTLSTTSIVDNEWIAKETKKIFKKLGLKGFASMEFKRHDQDGRYYVIEPTAGRVDQQEYVATLNGVNIPLAAYNYLTDLKIAEKPPKKAPIIFIDERADIASAYVHFKRKLLTFSEWRKSLRGNRAYRLWTFEDPLVSLFFVPKQIWDVFRWIVKRIIKR